MKKAPPRAQVLGGAFLLENLYIGVEFETVIERLLYGISTICQYTLPLLSNRYLLDRRLTSKEYGYGKGGMPLMRRNGKCRFESSDGPAVCLSRMR